MFTACQNSVLHRSLPQVHKNCKLPPPLGRANTDSLTFCHIDTRSSARTIACRADGMTILSILEKSTLPTKSYHQPSSHRNNTTSFDTLRDHRRMNLRPRWAFQGWESFRSWARGDSTRRLVRSSCRRYGDSGVAMLARR